MTTWILLAVVTVFVVAVLIVFRSGAVDEERAERALEDAAGKATASANGLFARLRYWWRAQ